MAVHRRNAMKIKLINSGNGRTPNPELGVNILILIKDLGVIYPSEKSTYKKRYGMYLCDCGTKLRVATSAVTSGRISNCIHCRAVQQSCPVDYMKRVVAKHGDTYDYSEFVYKSSTEPAKIICKLHKSFIQTPKIHVTGSGCPTCANDLRSITTRQNRQDPAILYYTYFPELLLWKLGVTTQGITKRFSGEVYDYVTLWSKFYRTAEQAYFVEALLLRTYSELRYKGPAILIRGGSTELLLENVLEKLPPSVETIESTFEFNNL